MMKDLSAEMEEVRAKGGSTQIEGMTELLTAMTGMMKQNQEMMTALLGSHGRETEPKAARRA
jgi:hypothetical protein